MSFGNYESGAFNRKAQKVKIEHSSAYDIITNLFGFLTRLDEIDDFILKRSVNNLVQV